MKNKKSSKSSKSSHDNDKIDEVVFGEVSENTLSKAPIEPEETPKLGESPKFSEEEIEIFLEECGKKPLFTLKEFSATITKSPSDLTYKDTRIIISKMGWLDDEERYKFRHILVLENLTEEENTKYMRIYPNHQIFCRYFPTKDNVEEHYKTNFINRGK